MNSREERVQAVLAAAVHAAAELNAEEDKRVERLEAWIERLSAELCKFLNMDRKEFRIFLHRTFQGEDHLYPFGDTTRYDDQSIAQGDIGD